MPTKARLTMIWLLLIPLGPTQPATAQSNGRTTGDPIALFEQRIALPTGSATDHAMLGDLYLRRARLTGNVGDVLEAELMARQSLALLPGYPLAESLLVRALSDQHRFVEARDLAARRIQRDPTDVGSALALVDALSELGDVEQAGTILRELEPDDRGEAVLARRAKMAYRRNPEDALALARQALDRARASHSSDEDWYHVFLADMLFDEGHFDEAETLLAGVRHRSPEFPAGLSVSAELCSARGDEPEALRHLHRLAALRPFDPLVAVAMGDAYSRLGDSQRSQEAYGLAESLFLSAGEQRPGIYDRQLSLLYADQQRNLTAALELAADDLARRESPESLAAMSWVLFRIGRTAEATEYMDRALETGVRDHDLYYRAAQVYRGAGREETAAHYFGLAHRWSRHLFPEG